MKLLEPTGEQWDNVFNVTAVRAGSLRIAYCDKAKTVLIIPY